ncbi:MAG: acyl carrier protein [Myxococcota bacterium]
MKKREITKAVREALRNVSPDADLKHLDPDVNFRDQFEMDSLDFLAFVLRLEQRFGRKLPESDYPRLSSLTGCLEYLGSRGSASRG